MANTTLKIAFAASGILGIAFGGRRLLVPAWTAAGGQSSSSLNTAVVTSSVVSSYTEQRVSGECWPDGIVITDPWGATGFNGCTG
jgi:hypothetical protein